MPTMGLIVGSKLALRSLFLHGKQGDESTVHALSTTALHTA